jgi:5-methylthioadenosine/S-adenosylhomocysteine deaminase
VTERTLFQGGCILTLGTGPNHPRGDLLIEEGKVAEVGPGIRGRGAEVVDATDTIVMPGFVDTHRHAWRSLFRNLGRRAAGEITPPAALAGHFGLDDVYAATLIGLLGAVEAGITTVVDWADIGPRDDLADAALQAHADTGLRTVFVLDAGSFEDDRALARAMARLGARAGPSTTIALGSSGSADRLAEDCAAARRVGAHIHVHEPAAGAISGAEQGGFLGPDVTVVHPSADLHGVAASGASVSVAPSSEMAGGVGPPPIQELMARRIPVGLGVDEEGVAPGDLFAQMRAAISMQHATVFDRKLAGKARLPRLMSTRDVLRWATADGARAAGLGGTTGSLQPEMRADVIVLRTDRPNVFPINDPIGAVVWGMDTSNVDWVVADGRVLMRDGVLVSDVDGAGSMARTARERVVAASGIAVGAGEAEG